MRTAGKYHVLRASVVAVMLVLGGWALSKATEDSEQGHWCRVCSRRKLRMFPESLDNYPDFTDGLTRFC